MTSHLPVEFESVGASQGGVGRVISVFGTIAEADEV